jgi:hypothetical protein
MKRQLRKCGFFRDLPFGEASDQRLKDSLDRNAAQDAERITSYLRAAPVYATVPGLVSDVLDPEERVIGPLRYLTDGEWAWRSDLAYYVERYHCRVPAEFVQHIRGRNWLPPAEEEIDMTTLSLWPAVEEG